MAALNPKALEALTLHQRQLDMDGVEVGVSRQALDELISAYLSSTSAGVTEEQVEALLDAVDRPRTYERRQRVRAVLEAAPSSQQAEAVPVAWLRERRRTILNTPVSATILCDPDEEGAYPVYRRPSPSYAEPGIKATDESIERARLIVSGPAVNRPCEERGLRIVGWKVSEDVAGLSEALFALDVIRSALFPVTSKAKTVPVGPVPTHECDFVVGQPVRLASPYPEMDPETVFYVTGISWEHRMVSARGWNIMVAGKDDIEKGYGQTDGYSPDDLLPARSPAVEGK